MCVHIPKYHKAYTHMGGIEEGVVISTISLEQVGVVPVCRCWWSWSPATGWSIVQYMVSVLILMTFQWVRMCLSADVC